MFPGVAPTFPPGGNCVAVMSYGVTDLGRAFLPHDAEHFKHWAAKILGYPRSGGSPNSLASIVQVKTVNR